MTVFVITFSDGRVEEISADRFTDSDDGTWIDFWTRTGGAAMKERQVLRVRSETVDRIEEKSE